MDVAVVVVGDEILGGFVQDANTHFIASRVAVHGHRLRRAVVVADDPEQIAGEIRTERAAGTRLVCACGGLGSTHDDRTMEGVAVALDRALEPCAPLAETIDGMLARAKEAGFSDDAFGGAALRKMALAPAGAELLRCSMRMVPAVAIDDEGFSVAVLPGPPAQLAVVFEEAVEPRYLAGGGEAIHRQELTHRFPESTLAALLIDLQARYASCTIGSYPQADHTLIRIGGPADDVGRAAAELRGRIDALERSEDGRRFLAYLRRARRGR